MDQPAHVRSGGRVAEGPPAACVGAWADVPRGAALLEQLLHTGVTHPKEGGHGPWGAEPLITGAQKLLSQVKGVCLHIHEPHTVFPYMQSRTAIISGLSRMTIGQPSSSNPGPHLTIGQSGENW